MNQPLSSLNSLEQTVRPLLTLVQRLTGLESAFVTLIDWDEQSQDVVFALNTSELVVPEGSQGTWDDSLCRLSFLGGRESTCEVEVDFKGSVVAERLALKSFFAIPVACDESTLGTVCGASRRSVPLGEDVLDMLRLIAQAIAGQMRSERDRRAHDREVARAEHATAQMRLQLEDAVEEAREMKALAWIDPLTGLYNRRAFVARWEEELARSARHGDPIAVLIIDVDHFKQVNDRHGHFVGDKVLESAAAAMLGVARKEDIVARLGGDEFVLAVVKADPVALQRLFERLQSAFAVACGTLGVECTLSAGIAISSDDTPRAALLESADRAVYRSKKLGRNRAEFWNPVADLSEMRSP